MWRRVVATVLAFILPASASAGPLKDAAERAARELASVQQREETRKGARFWTGIALLAGGGTLATLGSVEVGDDEIGPDDGEDLDDSDDGEDSDGLNKALIGGGIAAAALGGVLLFTGAKKSGPVVSVKPGGVAVRQTIRF
jgi:hypothetical protein